MPILKATGVKGAHMFTAPPYASGSKQGGHGVAYGFL